MLLSLWHLLHDQWLIMGLFDIPEWWLEEEEHGSQARLFGWGFYVLAPSKNILGQGTTCRSVLVWWICSAVPLGKHTTSNMTGCYLNTELTHPYHILIMSSPSLGSENGINLVSYWFVLTGNWTPDVRQGKPALFRLATTSGPVLEVRI